MLVASTLHFCVGINDSQRTARINLATNKVSPETNSQASAIALGWLLPPPQLRLWRSAAEIFSVKNPTET
jgi:hypothetical protein